MSTLGITQGMLDAVRAASALPGAQPDGFATSMQAFSQLFGIDNVANDIDPFDGVSMKNQTLATLLLNHGTPAVEALVVALAFSETGKLAVFDIMRPRGTTSLTVVWKRLVQDKTLMRRAADGSPARLVGSSQESGSTSLVRFALAAEMPVVGLGTRQGQEIAGLQIGTISNAFVDTMVNVALADLLTGRATHQAALQIRGKADPLAANAAARALLFFLNRPFGLPAYIKRIRAERNHQTYTRARIDRLLMPVGVVGQLPYLTATGNRANQGGEAASNRAYAGYGATGEGELPALPSDMRIGEIATEIYEGRYPLNQLITNVVDAGYTGFTAYGVEDDDKPVSAIYVANFRAKAISKIKLTESLLKSTGRWDANGNLKGAHDEIANDVNGALDLTKLDFAEHTQDVDPFIAKDYGSNRGSARGYVTVKSLGSLSMDAFTEEDMFAFCKRFSAMMRSKLSQGEIDALQRGVDDVEASGDIVGLLERAREGGAADNEAERAFFVALNKAYRAARSCFPNNPFVSAAYAPAATRPDRADDPSGYFAGLQAFMTLLTKFPNEALLGELNGGIPNYSTGQIAGAVRILENIRNAAPVGSFGVTVDTDDGDEVSVVLAGMPVTLAAMIDEGGDRFATLVQQVRAGSDGLGDEAAAEIRAQAGSWPPAPTSGEGRSAALQRAGAAYAALAASVVNGSASASVVAPSNFASIPIRGVTDSRSFTGARASSRRETRTRTGFIPGFSGSVPGSLGSVPGSSVPIPTLPDPEVEETGASGIWASAIGQRHRTLSPREHAAHMAPILEAAGARRGTYGEDLISNLFLQAGGVRVARPGQFPGLDMIRPVTITGNMAHRAEIADDYDDSFCRMAAYLFIAQPNTVKAHAKFVKCGLGLPIDLILWQLTTTFQAGTVVLSRRDIGRVYYANIHAMWGGNVVEKSVAVHLSCYFGAAVIENDVVVHPGAIANKYKSGGGTKVADVNNFDMRSDINKFDLIPTIASRGEMARMEGNSGIVSFTGRLPFQLAATSTPNETRTPMQWVGSMVTTILTKASVLNESVMADFLLGARPDTMGYSPLAGRRATMVLHSSGDASRNIIYAARDGLGDSVITSRGLKALAAGQGVSAEPNGQVIGLYNEV